MKKEKNKEFRKETKFEMPAVILAVALFFIFGISGIFVEAEEIRTSHFLTDRENYSVGETIYIKIINPGDNALQIETPSAKYELFGDAEGVVKFIPSETGRHAINLFYKNSLIFRKEVMVTDKINNFNGQGNSGDSFENFYGVLYGNSFDDSYNVSSDSEVIVSGEGMVFTDKKFYQENEMVKININNNFFIEELIIQSDSSKFYFNPEDENEKIIFVPDKSGEYILKARMKNDNKYYAINFSVGAFPFDELNASQLNNSEFINNGFNESYDSSNQSNASLSAFFIYINNTIISKELDQQLQTNNVSNISDLTQQGLFYQYGAVGTEKNKIRIVDSKGNESYYSAKFYRINYSAKSKDKADNGSLNEGFLDESNIFSLSDFESSGKVEISELDVVVFEKYDLEIYPDELFTKININNFVYTQNVLIGIDQLEPEKYYVPEKRVAKSYAINMERIMFSDAKFTITATGEELWKCALWNFSEQKCEGEWISVMNLTPGEEYVLDVYPGDPGYLETFSVLQSRDLSAISLDNNTVVLGWIDNAAGYNISFQVWNTNGSALTSAIVLDATGGTTSRVNLAPINSSHFSIAIFDQPSDNIDYFIYDRAGNQILGRTNAAATVGAFTDVKLCQLGDRFSMVYSRTSNSDGDLRMFYNNGTSLLAETQVDNNMGPEAASQDLVSCAAVNNTAFIYAWFDDASNDMTREVFNSAGTSIIGETDYDTDVGETAQIVTASLGNNRVVAAFYDATDDDITINVGSISGAVYSSLSTTDIDSNAGTDSRVDVAALKMPNTWYFAVAWIDTSDSTIKAGVYNQSGAQITAPFNVSTTPNATFPQVAVAGANPVINSGLCNGTFVVAYTNRSTGTIMQKYWYNGTLWDGICPDINPPIVVLNEPDDNLILLSPDSSFNFTATDDRDSVLPNCSLWTNITGSWTRNSTIYNVSSGVKTNFTMATMPDGEIIWNVQCYDNSSNLGTYASNYTLKINTIPPSITNYAINTTSINQSHKVKLNTTITDYYGISTAIMTLRYPNGTFANYTMNNTGSEYYYIINETTQLGIYNITFIWANDSLGQNNQINNPALSFEVFSSPPSVFNLLSPANMTESKQLQPTMSWQQTTEPDFDNYTLIIDNDADFSSPDFVYRISPITNTSFQLTYALDGSGQYYWKVIAYDIFSNSRNSTSEFIYITDNAAPNITLNQPGNNTVISTAAVLFNYTPEETNTLVNCSLYGNFTGTFAKNYTNSSLQKNTENYFYLTLTEGYYLWNVECSDYSGNTQFSSENYTFALDLSGPAVYLMNPSEGDFENETNNILFEANATDKYSALDTCRLIVNGTVRSTKSAINNIPFNFTIFLNNGNYTWKVNCTDDKGFESSSDSRLLEVYVVDNDPPLVTLNAPSNNNYSSSENITFNYTPQDATGISNCSLFINNIFNASNQTAVTNFVNNIFSINNFEEGTYVWKVGCIDNGTSYLEGNSSPRNLFIDLTNPAVNLSIPENGVFRNFTTINLSYTPYDYNINYCELYTNISGTWQYQETEYSPQNSQENEFEITASDGEYLWNVKCADLSGRESYSEQNYTVKIDTLPPEYSDAEQTPETYYSQPRIYSFNITWSDNFNVSTVIMEANFSGLSQNYTVNGTGFYSVNFTNVVAGNYSYKWYANDTANNFNETEIVYYAVARANSSLVLLLNSTPGNISLNENSYVNITAYTSVPAGEYIGLFIDDTLINNGTGTLQNISLFSDPGNYNATVIYYATQNYTESSLSYYVTINDTIPPTVSLMTPKQNGRAATGLVSFQYNVSDKSSINSCSLYINGSLNESGSNITKDAPQTFGINLEVGNYTWQIRCLDSNNNEGISAIRNITVLTSNIIVVNVSSDKTIYERGETAIITPSSFDAYDNILITNISADIIRGNTSLNWWNTSWKYRRPLFINSTASRDIEKTFRVNITNLSINSCNELRILMNETPDGDTYHEEINYSLVSNTSNSCEIEISIGISAGAVNENNYYVYYGNSNANTSPGYTLGLNGLRVQRGTVSGTGSTITATINSASTSNTFIIFTANTGSSRPDRNQYTPSMTLGTEINFVRYGATTSGAINYEAIESTDAYVQRGDISFAAGTGLLTADISNINLNKSFIIVNGRVNSGTNANNNQGFFMARFVNSSRIELQRQTTGVAATANWQVVEFNYANVQSGNTTFTGNGFNATLNGVNLSRTFVIVSRATSGATGIGANYIRANLTNSTNLELYRAYASGTSYVSWFVIELPEEYYVQSNSNSVSTADVNAAVTEVQTKKAFHAQSWSSTGTTSTTYTNALLNLNLTNSSNILIDKYSTTETQIARWFLSEERTPSVALGSEQEWMQRATNETNELGYITLLFNTSNKTTGNYSAVAWAWKYNYTTANANYIFELIPDKTPPNVTLLSPEDYDVFGVGYINFSYRPFDLNLQNCTLYIDLNGTFAPNNTQSNPINNGSNTISDIYVGIGLHKWNVGCFDNEGNLGFANANYSVNVTGPDLTVSSNSIWFGGESRVEGTNITIYANISNEGLTVQNESFIVQFFFGNPDSGGTQINGNITINNLSIGETKTINTTRHLLVQGINNIFVRIDPANYANESDENNNQANKSVTVEIYNYYYGNVTGNIVVGDDSSAFLTFDNQSEDTGHLFFVDADSSFEFSNLQALTRNELGQLVGNDFTDADTNLNTSAYPDSLKNLWGGGTDAPVETRNFNLSTGLVNNVPVINSSNVSSFVTGILWDTADDGGNLQYDALTKEDLVFVTEINQTQQGGFGLYDAEIRIPANLKNYKPGTSSLVIYIELK